MNFLNSIQSKLHGAVNPNSVQYIKQQDLQVQLDPSGTAYMDHGNQAFSLNVDDENTTALAILDKAPSTQPLSLSGQSQFTICLKHKVQDATNPLIGQYYTNPQYDLSLSSTAIGTLDTFQVNVFNASDDPVSYSITGGLTSADLSNADLSGTITNLYTPLSYTLRSGYGDFVFGLDGLSQQVSATMYQKYWVKSVTNLLGDLVFGFSSTGSGGDYLNQPDLSFGAGGKYMFDITDPTMTDLSLVFGTTVDNLSTVNDSAVTRTNDLVILDISAGYDGSRLVYFEDTSAGMGYVQSIDIIVKKLYNPPITSAPSPTSSPTAASGTLADIFYQRQIGADLNDGGEGRWIGTNESDWISLDLTTTKNVLGVLIQPGWHSGWSKPDQYITTLDIHVSTDNTNWTIMSNNISSSWNTDITSSDYDPQGNGWTPDSWKMALYFTSTTIYARYVRLYPTSHQGSSRALRFGVIYNSTIGGAVSDTEDLGSHTVVYELPDPTKSEIQVTVSSEPAVFYFDGSAKPPLTFTLGTTYVFDQSHESNANNTLVIGSFDVSSSIVSSSLTIMGTPGQPGAYTKYVSDGSTVHYFSYQTENMGTASPPPNINDDLYVHYDFEFPLYDPTGTERTDGLTGGSDIVRIKNKAYDSITNSDISYNGYLSKFGHGRAHLDSTIKKIGSSSLKVYESPVRSDNAWKLNNDQGYSICFWMKEDSASGPLFGMDNINGVPFFVIEYNSSTLTVNNNGTTLSYNISALTMTDWNHIAFTISPDGPDITWKLYINGSLVNTKTDGNYLVPQNIRSGYPVDLIFLVDIGARPASSTYIGYIDDFRFYKTELDQAQVSAVYSYTG